MAKTLLSIIQCTRYFVIIFVTIIVSLHAIGAKAGQVNKTSKSDSRHGYESAKGNYYIPINYSTEAVVAGIGSMDVMRDFVRRHSNKNLWTYVVGSHDGDRFLRMYGSHTSSILISWRPKSKNTIYQDFVKSVEAIKAMGIFWINNSEKELVLDGNKGMSGRAKAVTGDVTIFMTIAIVHALDRVYTIQYDYSDSFSDPDNTWEKIKQIKFKTLK